MGSQPRQRPPRERHGEMRVGGSGERAMRISFDQAAPAAAARMSRRTTLVALASCLAASAARAPARAQPLAKVTFSLDFLPLGRHAPWYAALGAGCFREEGLDVTIIPAQGTAQAVQAVDSGLAHLGLIDL